MAFTHRPRVPHTLNLELLEDRRLFAVSLGDDGWTDIDPSADTRVVYVSSSSGNDANGGLSAGAPVKTTAKARTLLRSGSPDWMLLKRGDAWTENLGNWTLSGRNEQEPMVIGAYGTGERPLLKTGTSVGFKNSGQVSHVSIVGIHFHAHTRDTESAGYNGTTAGAYGFHSMGRLDDVLVEDAVFDDYLYNLSVTGYDATITDFALRRSIITDAWSTDGKSQGMYVHKVNGMLLEENLFDHNGWNTDVAAAKATIYSHGIYMSGSNDDVVVRGNVIADSASHGMQARSGGVIENNLFLRNPINLLFGGGSTVKPGGVEGRVTGNVILDSRDISGSKRGTAMEFSNIKPGAGVVVADNIITADTQRNMAAISFGTTSDATNLADAVGINDLTIRDNIVYDWHSGWSMSPEFKPGGSGNTGVNNLKVQDNDFQKANISRLVRHGPAVNKSELYFEGNRYDNHDLFPSSGWFLLGNSTTTSFNTWKANVESTAQDVEADYADPLRTIGKYHGSIGGTASLSAFVAEAADQAKGAFDGRYSAAAVINYVRKGFAEDGVVPGGLLPVPSSGAEPGEVPGDDTGDGTDTIAPTEPTTLRATGTGPDTVGMTWEASTDNVAVTGYEIFRNGVKIATTTGTTYTDSGLAPSTSYIYTVKAYDAAGNVSIASNKDTGTTTAGTAGDTTAPTAPTTLRATGTSDTTVGMTWVASSDNVGVAGYEVFRNGVKVATTTGTSYTDSGLAPSTSYVYTVRAYDAAGNVSAASNTDTGTTTAAAPAAPAAPAALSATRLSNRKVRLNWSDSASNEDGFYVYTSTDGTSWTRYATAAAKSGSTSSVEYTTGSFSRGTRYFRVSAFNGAGESAPSNVATLTI